MFTNVERSYSEETVQSRSACSHLCWGSESHPVCLGSWPQRCWQWTRMKPCTIHPSIPCLLAKSGKGSLVIKGKVSGCCSGQDPLCEAREQHHGEQRGEGKLLEAPGSSAGAGTLKAAATNEGTWHGSTGRYHTLMVWARTCGEDLGMWRCEIKKKCRVTGDTGEHRIQTQQQQAFASRATHGTVGFGSLFLDMTHFFLEISVLKWHCLKI